MNCMRKYLVVDSENNGDTNFKLLVLVELYVSGEDQAVLRSGPGRFLILECHSKCSQLVPVQSRLDGFEVDQNLLL